MRNAFHKKKTVLILLLVLTLFAIPCIINVLYMYGYKHTIFPNTMYRASDLLAYFGTIVSAIASGVLGYIAYTLNKKVLALTEMDTERSKVATVILESIAATDLPWTTPIQGYNSIYDQIRELGFEKCADIGFHLYNIGPAPLARTVIYYMAPGNVVKASTEYICALAPRSRIKVQIPLINGQDVNFNFEFISCYNKTTYASCYIVPFISGSSKLDTIVDYQIKDSQH